MEAKKVYAVFETGNAILAACREARRRGLAVHDAHVPFPVHGLDEAMGLRPSRMPLVCLAFGLLGGLGMLAFQSWAFTADWPLDVGGKPHFAWPAFVPVTFESTVLLAGLGSVSVFFLFRGLLPGRGVRRHEIPASGHRFVLVLEDYGARFTDAEVEGFLRAGGAVDFGRAGEGSP